MAPRNDGAGRDDAEELASAFSLLGHETRVAIVLAIWNAPERPVPYSELMAAVGAADSGRFSYHLEKLRGEFVTSAEDGYDLRLAGEHVAQTIRSGAFTDDPTLERRTIDSRCPYCDAPVELAYDEEILDVRCTECAGAVGGRFERGTLMHYRFPSAGVADRSPEDALRAAHVFHDSRSAPMMNGVCPQCAGGVADAVELCSDHDHEPTGPLCSACDTRYLAWIRYRCENCRYERLVPLWFLALNHPRVVARTLAGASADELLPPLKIVGEYGPDVRGIEETLLSRDPLRVRVTFPGPEAPVRVTMGEGRVVDVEE